MSSSHTNYPIQPHTIDPSEMCSDVATGVLGTGWYTPTSYVYDPYITPYPSSTVENQPWTHYARSSAPNISYGTISQQHQGLQLQAQVQQHHQQEPQQRQDLSFQAYPGKDLNRPRSSPSTFGPAAENLNWMTSTGLGIQYSGITHQPQPTPLTSTFPIGSFSTFSSEGLYSTESSVPKIETPQPIRPIRSTLPNIAPAGGVTATKRRRDEDEQLDVTTSGSKKRKRTSSLAAADLAEDDRFLVQLKDDENLPWKDIVTRFHSDKGKTFQVAALQMRYKRLREKFRVWEDADVHALRLAHDYWEKSKWEIIGAKMLEYGLTERWSVRNCARKWQELETTAAVTMASLTSSTAGITPALSNFSSPIEGPVHFAFMPMQ